MKTIEEKMNELRASNAPTTDDIAELLALVGPSGENRQRKMELVESLGRTNSQGINISVTLEGYKEF
jgi:hypothetical protein